MVQSLSVIFIENGRGKVWCSKLQDGNPANSPLVRAYIKQISEEQAKAQVVPRQAKPMFVTKLRKLVAFIDREIERPDLSVRQRFVLLRDQAFFKMQFFAGDRAGDLARLPGQAIKSLPDGSGLAISHSFTKSIRGKDGKCNTFIIKRCDEKLVCPVLALDRYVQGCKDFGVDLALGYLFRLAAESGRVLDQGVCYNTMHSRLIQYLTTLGIYEGETPHSMRAGCAVTLRLSGAAKSANDSMKHIGWFTKSSCDYYSRGSYLGDAGGLRRNAWRLLLRRQT
jgi:hypothetical protein